MQRGSLEMVSLTNIPHLYQRSHEWWRFRNAVFTIAEWNQIGTIVTGFKRITFRVPHLTWLFNRLPPSNSSSGKINGKAALNSFGFAVLHAYNAFPTEIVQAENFIISVSNRTRANIRQYRIPEECRLLMPQFFFANMHSVMAKSLATICRTKLYTFLKSFTTALMFYFSAFFPRCKRKYILPFLLK